MSFMSEPKYLQDYQFPVLMLFFITDELQNSEKSINQKIEDVDILFLVTLIRMQDFWNILENVHLAPCKH